MKYFYGANRSGPYFEGWYLKHQSREGKCLALIPALHIDARGRSSASLQVITDRGAWWLEYPAGELRADENSFRVRLGQSRFDCRGVRLNIHQEGLSLRGILSYGPFTALRSHIMGPFLLFSGMQCSHTVISMGHSLEGTLELNGEVLTFPAAWGTLRGTGGVPFPAPTFGPSACGAVPGMAA